MTKPDERWIELHASGYTLSLLSREDNERMRKWINYNEDIQNLASWFRKFYATFNQIEASKANTASIPSVVHLKLWKTTLSLPNLFMLAAQMPFSDTYGAKLKTVKTFVSDTHKTTLRLLHDERNKQLNLHVISNYVGPDDIVLLRVNTGDRLLVSEPGGSFHFPDTKTDADPDPAADISLKKIEDWTICQLYLAVGNIRLYKDSHTGEINFDTTELKRDREELNLTSTNDRFQVTFSTGFNDQAPPQKAVFISDRQSMCIDIIAGVCSIPLDKMNGSQACLYFYDS